MYICNIKILYYIIYIPGCNISNMGYLTIFNVIFPRVFLRNPWIFRILSGSGGAPDNSERFSVIKEHLDLLREFKGSQTAASEFRKHAIWYLKGLRGSASVRDRICKTEDPAAIASIINEYFEWLESPVQQ